MANQESVSGVENLSYLNQQDPIKPIVIKAQRAPTNRDRRYKIGTFWIDQPNNATYQLTSVVNAVPSWAVLGGGAADVNTLTGDTGGPISPTGGNIGLLGGDLLTIDGSGSSLTFNTTVGGYPVSSFVVGPVGQAGYQTIQAALDAANIAGGGQIFVQPGTYTENLTFYPNIDLWGVSEQATIIVGIHTPPATGYLNIFRVTLQSATDIFNSAVAGTAALTIENVTVNVTNGYTFNLANWLGTIAAFDIGNFGTDDGFINNTAGAPFFVFAAGIGNGTTNIMQLTGPVLVSGIVEFDCPLNISGTASGEIGNGCLFKKNVTFASSAAFSIYGSSFATGSSPAITHNSSQPLVIQGCTIDSTNNPAITGTGAGILTLAGIDFINNDLLAGTLTLNVVPSFLTGGIKIVEGANSRMGVATLVAGTVAVNTTAVQGNSRIFLTHQNNSGTPGFVSVTVRNVGVSFTITSSSGTDTSDIAWIIIQPA